MAPYASAVGEAAETLQRISERTPGERGRRAGAVALVLRAVERLSGGRGDEFVRRRAEAEVEGIASAEERRVLRGLLSSASAGPEGEARLVELLVGYGCELESARRVAEAEAVLSLARRVRPGCAEVALHCGRLARKQGDAARALELYAAARRLDGAGPIARLAAVGEAVVSGEPERALGRVVREAVRAGDVEAAAVALEERARARRRAGNRSGAARDLCIAAARYPDAVDRGRVAHELADLCTAAVDPAGAREALLVALTAGDSSQREHARSRLHTVSRDMGDQVGMRRWRSFERPRLVSLSSTGRGSGAVSLAGFITRWRARAESRSVLASAAKG